MLSSLKQAFRELFKHVQRSSAVQQGLLNLSVFLISLFLLAIGTWLFVQNELSSRLEANLQQRMAVLQNALNSEEWEEEDDDELPYQRLGELRQGDSITLLFPSRELSQEANRAFRKTGRHSAEIHLLRIKEHETFELLVHHKNRHVLVVGENSDNNQEILAIILSAFLLNGLVALLLTGLLVTYLGQRSHRQIQRIEQVLQSAAQGNLKQRIGPSTKNDDLAHVSDQIDAMLERLDTTMTAMTDISANIAHELKTPVARLRDDLTQALDQHEQGLPVDEQLHAAYEESTQITETFDALLRIAQIEGGSRRAHFKAIDLPAIIATVLEIYIDVAEDSGMSLQQAHSESLQNLQIQGDRELLIQMLANLIENALRYCPAETVISIEARQREEKIELSVSDNGPGIPEQDRKRVFERLYRVDKSRSDQRGTGLGLSLVKAIVELHNAQIELLDNQPGTRARITFSSTWRRPH